MGVVNVQNDDMNTFIVFVLCLVIIILNCVLLITYVIYKKRKIKSDIVSMEQFGINLLFCVCICYYVIKNFQEIILTNENKWIYYLCIGVITFNEVFNVFRKIELVYEMKKPFYIFTSIFNEKAKNIIWEILSIGTVIFVILIDIYTFNNINDNTLGFYIKNGYVIMIYLLLLIINIGLIISLLMSYFGIRSENKKDFLIKIITHIVICFTFLGFVLFLVITKYCFDSGYHEDLAMISSYIIMGYLLLNSVCEMIIIKLSEFYFFILSFSRISIFYKLFGIHKEYVHSLYQEDVEYVNIKTQKNLIVNNFQKKCKFMNVFSGLLERSEYCLNCALAGIYLILERECVQGNNTNVNNIEIEMGNTRQDICEHNTNNPQESFIKENNNLSINNANNIIIDKQFTFTNKDFDTSKHLSILTDYYQNSFSIEKPSSSEITNTTQVTITSLYHLALIQNIKTKNININLIKQSLIAHATSFLYLISKNSKDNTFSTLPTLTLNTSDKHIFIQIFDSINLNILNQYIIHFNQNYFTFLPNLIGAYKVTINNNYPFYIFIVHNEFLNSNPNTGFNYWKIMKYTNDQSLHKIASSTERTSFRLSNDKSNETDIKIKIKNYDTFTKILKDDFTLLKQINAKHFILMFICYELEKEHINDNDNSINDFTLINESKNEINNNNILNTNSNDINIFDPNRFSVFSERILPSILNNNKNELISHDITFRNSQALITKANCFEGESQNFICNVFFSFEHIFEFRGFSFRKINYDECMTQLLKYFDYFALDDNN